MLRKLASHFFCKSDRFIENKLNSMVPKSLFFIEKEERGILNNNNKNFIIQFLYGFLNSIFRMF